MPIAHCIISDDLTTLHEDPISLWAQASQKNAEHMTINFITRQHQFGAAYLVMANLYLPSIWEKDAISNLQIGLARALAQYFSISTNQVHVITHRVQSGHVVENAQEINW